MGRSSTPPLRALPRFFLPGLEVSSLSGAERIELPAAELDKLRKVLRLSSGDELAILPNNGSVIRCEFDGRNAIPTAIEWPDTNAKRAVTLALGIPRPEKLEEAVRMATELGAARFVVFPAQRTVVRWDRAKLADRLQRLRIIAQEASEVCYRTILPEIEDVASLETLLQLEPQALVLSELEGVGTDLCHALQHARDPVLVIGPEGGWAPREVEQIGDRAVTLGPRVFRVDTAATAAAALAILGTGAH